MHQGHFIDEVSEFFYKHFNYFLTVAMYISRTKGITMKLIVTVTTMAAHASHILLGTSHIVDINAATITENVRMESPVR